MTFFAPPKSTLPSEDQKTYEELVESLKKVPLHMMGRKTVCNSKFKITESEVLDIALRIKKWNSHCEEKKYKCRDLIVPQYIAEAPNE